MADPSTSTTALLEALPALEASIGALKEKSWSETTEALPTLDRAKMDVLLSYAINDLIWVYLKLKGVDPATHDVSSELERIKKYYGKIKSVEEPSKPSSKLDVDAARRFINHSIPRSQRVPLPDLPSTSAAAQAASDAAKIGESGDTSLAGRFRFIAKETEKVVPDDQSGDEEGEEAGTMDVDGNGFEGVDAENEADAFMEDFNMELEKQQAAGPVEEILEFDEGDDVPSATASQDGFTTAQAGEAKRTKKGGAKKKRKRQAAN